MKIEENGRRYELPILKWLMSALISPIIVIISFPILDWLVGFILKIFYFVVVFGSRFDIPPITEFDNKMADFKSFIFITCLSALISFGLGGYIGGKIAPTNKGGKRIIFTLTGILIGGVSVYNFWNSEHWFYSSVWVIAMIVGIIIYVGVAEETE